MSTVGPCKCCASENIFPVGEVDFNKACWDREGTRVFPPSDVMVPYFACRNCGFIFTTYVDNWSPEDFKTKIYNEDYPTKVNPPPPNEASIPTQEKSLYRLGQNMASLLQGAQSKIRILDYGAGSKISLTGQALQDGGFQYFSYEPYLNEEGQTPDGTFDFIFAIQVVEHCHDLSALVDFIKTRLAENGIFYVQTLLHPFPTPPNILSSWYISPRDGHVSIFTFLALTSLFRRAGLNVVQTVHGILVFKGLPRFPNKFFV